MTYLSPILLGVSKTFQEVRGDCGGMTSTEIAETVLERVDPSTEIALDAIIGEYGWVKVRNDVAKIIHSAFV